MTDRANLGPRGSSSQHPQLIDARRQFESRKVLPPSKLHGGIASTSVAREHDLLPHTDTGDAAWAGLERGSTLQICD